MAAIRFLAGLAAVALLAAHAFASPEVTITPSAYWVERGDTVTFMVAGSGMGSLYAYQAQLALPAGLSVGGPSAIHGGNFFTSANTETIDASIPSLIARSVGTPAYETHDAATLASFDVAIGQSTPLGGVSVSTLGTNMLDANSQSLPQIQQGSTLINVVAPELSLSQSSLDLLADPGLRQAGDIVLFNIGLDVTMLNGTVGSLVLSEFNGQSPDEMANPFTMTRGSGDFVLSGAWSSQKLTIEFAPSVPGTYRGYFDIISDDGIGGTEASGSTARVYVYGSTAPEPAAIMLMAIGSLVIVGRRKRSEIAPR